jgi:hemerythrin-like metal-binding protein
LAAAARRLPAGKRFVWNPAAMLPRITNEPSAGPAAAGRPLSGEVMAFVEWDARFATGNAAIDTDHKKLMSYVNELHEALSRGKGRDVLASILDKLAAYTADHFGREEAFWTARKYPHLAAHKKLHADLLATVADFRTQYGNRTVTLTLSVMDFLRDWLLKHILEQDVVAARECAALAA